MRLPKLLNRLIRRPNPILFDAAIAPETDFFVVGDVHGCDDLLAHLLDKIGAMTSRHKAPIIFVGDYIDRGKESLAVLDRLFQLDTIAKNPIVCLLGNHEEMLIKFLEHPEEWGPRWLRNGGLQTLSNFQIHGVSQTTQGIALTHLCDELKKRFRPDILNWLQNMPTSWNSGNVTVVHAGARPNIPLADQTREVLLWGHPSFHQQNRDDGQWVVHGHTIVPDVTVLDGKVSVDTGAYATGRLSAVFISASGVETV